MQEVQQLVDYREILRLRDLGYSRQRIASTGIASRDKVGEIFSAADSLGISWPLDDGIINSDLQRMMFPGLGERRIIRYAEPDYTYIYKELSKPGVTLTLLWEEYCRKCYENGTTPYMSTQFSEKYRKWARAAKATMRIQHKPGDAMQVDWAGSTIPVYDSVTGEEYAAYLFVAVLPCSCYAYAEACSDMRSENWLQCHVHAFHYFGGSTRLLIMDNLKTGVTSNTRYETVLNRSYQEMAEHYGTAAVPARVRKPQDKSHAENTVRFVSTWIIAALRDRKFFSIQDVRDAVSQKLEELNDRPFKKREGTRKLAYLSEEKEFMIPLPTSDYELSTWSTATVGRDYLVSDGKNKYSVPFDLIGEKVDIRITKKTIEAFYHGNRIASHMRLPSAQRDPVVRQEHMPTEHRKYLNYNMDDFILWGRKNGPNTEIVVRYHLTAGKTPEQGYKSCASLIRLSERYGGSRLETACERVLASSSAPSVRSITSLLKSGRSETEPHKTPARKPNENSYGITRGADYFGKRGDYND